MHKTHDVQLLTLSEVEKHHALATLAHFGGNQSKAALSLGIARKTLNYKLRDWGCNRKALRKLRVSEEG